MKPETYVILCHVWLVGFVLATDSYRYALLAMAVYFGAMGIMRAWKDGESYREPRTEVHPKDSPK